MDNKELFIDGFGNIMVTGTMVRIDLVSLAEPAEGDRPARFDQRLRLVLPLDGFLRSFAMTENVVKKMVEEGGVGVRQPEGDGTSASVVESVPPSSPNFN